MAKYVFPAVFTPEENGMYSVDFPDLEGCYTCGEDLVEAIDMAEDALALMLYEYEKDGRPIPSPSPRSGFSLSGDEFVNLISCDTLSYQKRNNKKSVKKTLSIPEWLNEAAVSAEVNFSQVLQEALIDKLHLA